MHGWLTPPSRVKDRREPSWARPSKPHEPKGARSDDWTEPPPARSRSRHTVAHHRRVEGASSASAGGALRDLDWLSPAGVSAPHSSVDAHPIASLRVSALAIACNQRTGDNGTTYAVRGKDRKRIRQILSGTTQCCPAACKQQCRLKLRETEVAQICDLYWSLPSEEQALLIAIIKDEARGGVGDVGDDPEDQVRTQWAFGDHIVCFDAWCKLLGSSKKRILKMVRGECDARRSSSGPLILQLAGSLRCLCCWKT